MSKKLAEFEPQNYGVYAIYGQVAITDGDIKFSDLKLTVNGEPTEPRAFTWAGNACKVQDYLENYMSALSRNDQTCRKIYLAPELEDVVAANYEPVITVNGIPVSRYVLGGFLDKYLLMMVTSEFIYYANDYEELLMLRTSNHEVVSNNSFAENGLDASVLGISEGKEELLWGALPPEE